MITAYIEYKTTYCYFIGYIIKQTIAHFIIFSFIYFPITIYGGWMPKGNIARIKYIVFYVMIYIIAWFILKACWKRKTIEINKNLELKHK
ncbi:DUF3021 family protein [Clostridium sporogenes]|uniref:DUF3021 family protein n=1 Tax=Clostridium sporogenes TaxID=1509 RepID=UPI0009B533FB